MEENPASSGRYISRRDALSLFGAAIVPALTPQMSAGTSNVPRKRARDPAPPVPEEWRPLWLRPGDAPGRGLESAHWIWFPEGDAAAAAPVGIRWFRRRFDVTSGRTVRHAGVRVTADNAYVLYVNGTRVGGGDDFRQTDAYDVTGLIHAGSNVLAVAATNGADSPNPAGLILALTVTFSEGDPLSVVTDSGWRSSRSGDPGWERPTFPDAGWSPVKILGPHGMAPWGTSAAGIERDVYAAFRGTFDLPRATRVHLDVFGAHWFNVWVDGTFLTDGPYRFPPDRPEYETRTLPLARGRHVIAAAVRCEGVSTRMLQADRLPPFFLCRARAAGTPIPVRWKAARLDGYVASRQRVNPQFAWMEWVDTRRNPEGWHKPDFDDDLWPEPAEVAAVKAWPLRPSAIGPVHRLPVAPRLLAQGRLSGAFDGAARPPWKTDTDLPWYGRDLAPRGSPNGVWRRYDLGQVRLGAPEFVLDLPAGAVVEIGYSEQLRDGRVTPFIPLSTGVSRNLDHFIARGGVQAFSPLAPKGGRFLEVHVQADPAAVRFVSAAYAHRTYYGPPAGSFRCADRRLNAVWTLGIDTLRACCEDAVTDNPTRERGQWTGDVLPALDIAAAGYSDLRLFRRAIEQAAYCADGSGLVAGLCPGGTLHLSTYAAQWVTAALHYHDLTGDRGILDTMYPYAVRNLQAFEAALGPNGVRDSLGWAFVDWGYPGTPGTDADIAMNLHVLEGVRGMQRWCWLLKKDRARYDRLEGAVRAAVLAWLTPRLGADNWTEIGYHRAVLALRSGLIPAGKRPAAAAFLKRHILDCFPNKPDAPRLSSPDVRSTQLVTPYFAHYAFPELVRAGETDFVLEQYRRCWGWALDQGLTTQPEVFDLNWSHCHVWASCPTAQMTRYLLGLRPRFSAGRNHFDLTLQPGSLPAASGTVAMPNGNATVAVRWTRSGPASVGFNVRTPETIWLHQPGEPRPFARVESETTLRLRKAGSRWA